MARFMEIKSVKRKLKQNQITKELGYSRRTLQRYRTDRTMLSPDRFPPNNTNKRRRKCSNTNLNDKLNREHDLERLQMTSNDLYKPEAVVKKTTNKRNKNVLKAGSVHENFEIDDDYLDEFPHKNNI